MINRPKTIHPRLEGHTPYLPGDVRLSKWEYKHEQHRFVRSYTVGWATSEHWVASPDAHVKKPTPQGPHAASINYLFNDVRHMNKALRVLNAQLSLGGRLSLKCELLEHRYALMRRIWGHLYPLVFVIDYLVHRVWPRLPWVRGLYFAITGGYNRAISKAELLGRLYANGFVVEKESLTDTDFSVWAVKRSAPKDCSKASYGPLIALKRSGKNGSSIRLYKLRTMHPYSEFIQEYVYQKNNLEEGGKFKDDFRVTGMGQVFRKYWLDELPSLINLLRGDIKLVGVRPLSAQYLSLYSDELRELRKDVKPGLIPPIYADSPKSIDDIIASETRYLKAYENAPLYTDLKYLMKVTHSILWKRLRSA